MFAMIWKYEVAGLNVVRIILYILSAPFVAAMIGYGLYFIVIGFAWVVLVDAAFVSAVMIFMINFFMAFAALFNGSIWGSMGNMWNWLWSWFADGNTALWPYFVKSFTPYFGAAIVLMLTMNSIKYIKGKASALKAY